MQAVAEIDPPPKPTDLAGWGQIVREGRLANFPLEAAVSAFLDLGPNTDPTVRHALTRHLSDEIYTRLRRWVFRSFPNEGRDIIDRAHFQLFEALARPESADARGMREAFASRVMFRLKDALAKEARERRVPDEAAIKEQQKSKRRKKTEAEDNEENVVGLEEHPDLADEDNSEESEITSSIIPRDLTLLDGVRNLDEQIDVNRFLEENIPDDRKRLAFRLFMDDVPYKSKKSYSIAKAMAVDEKTVRQWIEEVQEKLKARLGEQT